MCGKILNFSLTGDWQKDSCTIKDVRKIHMELGRKGKEGIRSGPVLLGGDSEEEGDHTSREPCWGVRFEPHIGHPSPGVGHWEPQLDPSPTRLDSLVP